MKQIIHVLILLLVLVLLWTTIFASRDYFLNTLIGLAVVVLQLYLYASIYDIILYTRSER